MDINILAVLVCGVAAMIVGMIWHSKMLFGPAFMDAAGMDMNMPPEKMKEIQKTMWQLYITQFALALIEAAALSLLIESWGGVKGVVTAVFVWVGFVMPTVAGACIWSPRPRAKAWKQFLISAGYHLVLLAIYGLILGCLFK